MELFLVRKKIESVNFLFTLDHNFNDIHFVFFSFILNKNLISLKLNAIKCLNIKKHTQQQQKRYKYINKVKLKKGNCTKLSTKKLIYLIIYRKKNRHFLLKQKKKVL